MKIVVTGGSGFVGKRLQLVEPDWIYLSSEDVDLLSLEDCLRVFEEHSPDAVIHLAGKVGGIKDNSEKPAEFFYQNIIMNANVVHAAYLSGVKRLLASLSTCAFPDSAWPYPFKEEALFAGPPAKTNFPYGFSKRALYTQICAYRDQYNLNYTTFSPSNLYGPGDYFDEQKSHFVAAMIRRMHEAGDGESVEFWGTGHPLRQQLYVDDLAKAIPLLLDLHDGDFPIIVAPDENLSVREMILIFDSIIKKNLKISFNGKLDGQFRKDGCNDKFMHLIPDFKFTPFEEGIRKTYEWYTA